MPPILEVRRLEKTFPGVRAVDGIDFAVAKGACFGLLGPNGAGKTTTMEMLEGIIAPTAGQILFHGEARRRRFKQAIGIQFQTTALQDFLTTREALTFFATLYDRHVNLQELIERCNLTEYIDRDTRKLSGGQKQRLLLAIALVNDPELLFLDEPTTGLDPQSRRNFWRLIEGIRAEGKTILLTTHYMEEAERLCTEVAIMDCGRIIAHGEPEALLRAHFRSAVIRLPASALPNLERFADARPVDREHVEVSTDDVPTTLNELERAGAMLDSMRVGSPTLEDLFIKLTGHQLRT